MHLFAKRYFEKILGENKLCVVDKSCTYYPCHPDRIEDCTFCACPFFPCGDVSMGGRWSEREWSCTDCNWVHQTEVASMILEKLMVLGINKSEDIENNWSKFQMIREEIKALHPPNLATS